MNSSIRNPKAKNQFRKDQEKSETFDEVVCQ